MYCQYIFSALQVLNFILSLIIDTIISIKQRYNHTTISKVIFCNTSEKYSLLFLVSYYYFSRLKYQNEIYAIIAMKILCSRPNCI